MNNIENSTFEQNLRVLDGIESKYDLWASHNLQLRRANWYHRIIHRIFNKWIDRKIYSVVKTTLENYNSDQDHLYENLYQIENILKHNPDIEKIFLRFNINKTDKNELKSKDSKMWTCTSRNKNDSGGYIFKFQLLKKYADSDGSVLIANNEIYPAVELS